MKNLVIILSLLFFNICTWGQQNFRYISPKNNAKLVSLNTNLILRAENKIDFSNINNSIINIVGEKSGTHKVKIKLSDDGKTLILVPEKQFSPDEDVSAVIKSGIKTETGAEILPVSFQFKTTPLSQPIKLDPFSIVADGFKLKTFSRSNNENNLQKKIGSNEDSLPSDFPQITIDSVNNPADGKIFLANFPFGVNDSIGHFLMILNNDGSVDRFKRIDNPGFDFKVLPNGNLSYAEVIQQIGGYANVRWIEMDTSLVPVDTFQCGNGYTADLHEFKLLPNGHAILMAYDPEPVDMSLVVDGGDPNATVLGCIVQELDADKNVIFQWRSWDYIPFADSYESLTTATVDYLHMNGVSVDLDGNYLISCRQLSQILKVDRSTGDVIWKLGGKQNDFSFLNENEANSPDYFSYQHNISVLPNGNLTLFDNGNQHSPQHSRAVEYKIDEVNKTANMVWEYRHTPDIYSMAMGSVQRLSNGNTLIGWGSAGMNGDPSVVEVHPDKSIAFELTLPKGETSYRAFRFPWVSQQPAISVTNYEILQGNTYDFNDTNDTTGISIKVNQIDGLAYTSLTGTLYKYAPENPQFNSDAPLIAKEYFKLSQSSINSFEGEVHLKVKYHSKIIDPENTIAYLKAEGDNTFKPLATSYSSSQNELIFTTTQFGDFVFGIPVNVDSVYAPILLSPKNEELVNEKDTVNLVWGTKGIVSEYQLQVSSDSLFSSIIVEDTLSSTSFELGELNNNTKYYWRLKANNSAGESEWSETFNFVASITIHINYIPKRKRRIFWRYYIHNPLAGQLT